MMMQSNNKFERSTTTSFKSLAICILAGLLFSACGGGISGTGDGGPIIIDPAPTTGADADNADGVSSSTTEDISGVQSPVDSSSEIQSPDISQIIPQALELLIAQNENVSRAQPLAAQLSTLQQQVNATLISISTVQGIPEESMNDSLDIALRYSVTAPDTNSAAITGSEAASTETVVAQSSTSNTSYLFSTNSDRAIQILQQGKNITVRHLDRTSNSLLQATIIPLSDSVLIIEADLNENGFESYLQILSNESTTTVYSQHPTDPTIARQRELINSSGDILTVQNCTDDSVGCNINNSWSNANATTETEFTTALTAIENNLAGAVAPVQQLPERTNQAVVTQFTTTNPTDEQILCGIQRVTETIRSFCLLPQPFGQTSLFSETLAGSQLFYQLLE